MVIHAITIRGFDLQMWDSTENGCPFVQFYSVNRSGIELRMMLNRMNDKVITINISV